MWNELVCLRMKTGVGLLWIREWTFTFLKRRELSGKLSRIDILWASFAVERQRHFACTDAKHQLERIQKGHSCQVTPHGQRWKVLSSDYSA
jgi:hypothetical protein